MRFGEAIDSVRELLQGADTVHWTELEIGRFLNREVRSLSRRMVAVDEGWFNHDLFLAATVARQKKTDVWVYTLPVWCSKIVDVRESNNPDPTVVTDRGTIQLATGKHGDAGYTFSAAHLLQLIGYGIAIDLEIVCAKLPARCTKGTLPAQTSMTTTQMRLDVDTGADALLYPHETVADSYANTIVEITGNTARSGQIRRVTGSSHFQDLSGTLYTELTLEEAGTTVPLVSDTYEMHLEIPEEHIQVPLLMAVNSLWATRGNTAEQRAIAPKLAHEMERFIQHITPRQVQEPRYLRTTIMPPYAGRQNTEDTRNPLWM